MKTTLRTVFVLAVLLFPLRASAVPCDHFDYIIECGDTISVPLPSLTQVMDSYTGFAYGYDAGEYVLQWTAPIGISTLDVVHASNEDHAVFLMGPGGCDSDATGWWDNTGFGSINSGLLGAEIYYLSVDAELPIDWNSWVHVSFICNGTPYEFCGGGGDEDSDGLADCNDPNCTQYWGCLPVENCYNGVDDTGDGLADCLDPLCFSHPFCHPEDCSDGVDNNNDMLIDCLAAPDGPDPWCVTLGLCPETDCGDGKDNDNDGLVDCQDPDCPNYPCPPEDCTNGIDDDMDGVYDCADLDCICEPVCWGGEICDNNIDDDKDGAEDCDDCECYLQAPCIGEVCDDLLDNDGDGYVDCNDPECTTHPSCTPSEAGWCNDYLDNDGDGLWDCDDPDCINDAWCTGLCDTLGPLLCGDITSWQSLGMNDTDILFDYTACGEPGLQLHPETAWELPQADLIEVTATEVKGALSKLAILEAPSGDPCNINLSCVAVADPGVPINLKPNKGSTYYAIVESDGYEAQYFITANCSGVEDCGTPGDQDKDGLDDCDDPDCKGYPFLDNDEDGFDFCDDCDDGNSTIYPGADEVACDGIDQDCDGADLEELDADGDGYQAEVCDGDDCDDDDPDVHPGAKEVCDDGVDNDCDGDVDGDDEDCDPADDDTTDDDDDDDDNDTEDDDGGDDDTGEPPCEGCCCEDCSMQQTRTRSGLTLTLITALLGLLARRRSFGGRSDR